MKEWFMPNKACPSDVATGNRIANSKIDRFLNRHNRARRVEATKVL